MWHHRQASSCSGTTAPQIWLPSVYKKMHQPRLIGKSEWRRHCASFSGSIYPNCTSDSLAYHGACVSVPLTVRTWSGLRFWHRSFPRPFVFFTSLCIAVYESREALSPARMKAHLYFRKAGLKGWPKDSSKAHVVSNRPPGEQSREVIRALATSDLADVVRQRDGRDHAVLLTHKRGTLRSGMNSSNSVNNSITYGAMCATSSKHIQQTVLPAFLVSCCQNSPSGRQGLLWILDTSVANLPLLG